MADRQIIFSAPMVRALLEGRKTQTRRVLRAKSGIATAHTVQRVGSHWLACEYDRRWPIRLPYAPGDRLWVREAFTEVPMIGPRYYATNEIPASFKKVSPIHMPRCASRLTLLVTDVRVQRLHEISDEDANAEGAAHCDICNDVGWLNNNPDGGEECGCCGGGSYRDEFRDLWNSIHGPDAWDANPWVAAITFDVKHGNIDTPTGGTNDRS